MFHGPSIDQVALRSHDSNLVELLARSFISRLGIFERAGFSQASNLLNDLSGAKQLHGFNFLNLQ
jgi:hypothetical protein